MGWAYLGVCHETTAAALDFFALNFPMTNPSGAVEFTSTPSISAAGLITFTFKHRNFINGMANGYTGSLGLKTCTPSGALTLTDVFAIPTLQDAANAWAAGFLTPMLVGLIAWGVARVINFK
jgi:hypothetical protein